MTVSPSEVVEGFAARVAEAVDGDPTVAFGTAKVRVPPDRWRKTLEMARDELGLIFFSWLSAVDWSNSVAVGDPLQEQVEERLEVLAAVADVSDGRIVVFSTDLPKESPVIGTLTGVFPGANWHEREAHEMFGIDFVGHPDPSHLYLPDEFHGHPLRKSFPLLAREVKPWPGTVDVEGMPGVAESSEPTTDNPEG